MKQHTGQPQSGHEYFFFPACYITCIRVVMRTATWTRDSHGLFDYESTQILKKSFATHQIRYLARMNVSGEVKLLTERELSEQDSNELTVLFKVSPSGSASQFVVENCSRTDIYEEANDKLWLIVRSLKKDNLKENCRLNRGEILKLGRMRIKLKDYRIVDAINACDRVSNEAEEGPVEAKACDDQPKDENDTCKICFNATSDPTNPLISACKCTGTMKFIHFQCLKAWMSLKLVVKESPMVKSYFWKSFECEICKSSYPYCILHTGTRYSLIDVKKPEEGSFVMLESLNHEKNTSRIIHIVTPTETKSSLKMGRGHESDVRVTDISVSRFHASINCTKQGIYIEDNDSKFGTLVLVPKLDLDPSLGRVIQVGRTIINFEVRPQRIHQYFKHSFN